MFIGISQVNLCIGGLPGTFPGRFNGAGKLLQWQTVLLPLTTGIFKCHDVKLF